MIESMFFLLTLLTGLGCGLIAGLFFVFSNTVMRALGRLQSSQGIAAMQSINKIILNPLFFSVFIGTAIGSFFLLISLIWRWSQPESFYLLVGSLLYLVGVMFVTIRCNVPMNNNLDSFDPEDSKAAEYWAFYLNRWTRWNHVRAVTSFLSTASFILALS